MSTSRVFKTAWFSKRAKKSAISDSELCAAIKQVMQGQADNLGGGVFKKRLNNNMHRSIILAKGEHFWVYQYLFAKKDLDNIDEGELLAFRQLAKSYAELTTAHVDELVRINEFMEICHDS
ncbi:MAG: type II toxin-antitoxin system RelE/ParE family toxin [Candidatus Saccharibacteria bacterium]|nr:type II toxin-antitoxin system RelE/ParE family toxin [Moraxellaceae bacterium]